MDVDVVSAAGVDEEEAVWAYAANPDTAKAARNRTVGRARKRKEALAQVQSCGLFMTVGWLLGTESGMARKRETEKAWR